MPGARPCLSLPLCFFFFLSPRPIPSPLPLPHSVLVEKLAPPTKTVGGILLPESATAGKVRERRGGAEGVGARACKKK